MALKKITASGTTTIASGKTVSFTTEGTGSIVLLPGFKAEHGSNFSTQRKDLSKYSRICPETLCATEVINNYLYRDYNHPLAIWNLLYAVRVEYEIYSLVPNSGWIYVYGDAINVVHNGTVYLWDGHTGAIITQGVAMYMLYCTVHFCNGDKRSYMQPFVVKDYGKSSNARYDETGDPPQFSTLDPNNTPLQSATTPPKFTIIPNPNSGTFQLETNFPLSDISNLKISNLLGATVYETQYVSSYTIQLPNSAAGQYFVVIVFKDGTVLRQKMVVR